LNFNKQSVFTPFLRRFTDEIALERSETIALYAQVRAAHHASVWCNPDAAVNVSNTIAAVLGDVLDIPSCLPLAEAMDTCQRAVLAQETTIFTFPEIDWSQAHLSMKEAVDLRRFLRAKQHFLANEERVFGLLRDATINMLGAFIKHLPSIPEEEGQLTIPVFSLIPNIAELLDHIIFTANDEKALDAGLFASLSTQLYENVCRATGIPPYVESKRPLVLPTDSDLPAAEMVGTYLRGTPFLDLYCTPVPITIDEQVRFQHQWIVGQTGTGKSTLLQYLITRDLTRVANDECSIVVMESNRDLIKSIEGLQAFAPGGVLAGRLVNIDVEDVEFPIAFNLFDVGMETIHKLPPRDREAMLNSILSLYSYIFSALLSAEMTSRQSTLFNFTIELLLQIPSANLDTLIDLMQPKGLEQFRQYLVLCSPDTQRFFSLKFNSTEFNKTKDQVVDRLFAVKRIRTLSRMFAAPKSKLDLYKEMGSGKVVLVNAAKSLLQEDGVEIVGRFFISMILLAAQKRQLLPREQRLPCFVYIDECQDFINRDPKIPVILDQARKLNVGLILAHQRLAQLEHSVLDALYGATSIKFAAGISDAGSHALARDMRTTPEFIMDQPPYHFAAYIRGVTRNAISLGIPHTDMNRYPRMTDHQMRVVRADMRERYAIHHTIELPKPVESIPEPTPVHPAVPVAAPQSKPQSRKTAKPTPSADPPGADKW
jgi:hypothetical protein